MKASIEFLIRIFTSPWIGFGSLLVGLLGVLLFFRGKKERKPCYEQKSNNILTDLKSIYGDIEVKYASVPIGTFTATRIAFWNHGRATIDKTDIPAVAPIKIVVDEGCRILNVKELYKSENSNEFTVVKNVNTEREATIQFEYLDRGDGGVIEVLHTGESNENIKVEGRVKGAKLCRKKEWEGDAFLFGLAIAVALSIGVVIQMMGGFSNQNEQSAGQIHELIATVDSLTQSYELGIKTISSALDTSSLSTEVKESISQEAVNLRKKSKKFTDELYGLFSKTRKEENTQLIVIIAVALCAWLAVPHFYSRNIPMKYQRNMFFIDATISQKRKMDEGKER